MDGLFFSVKGSRHPEGLVIAYLRYVPDPAGDRVREGIRYHRVKDLKQTTDLLESRFPQYLNHVQHLDLTLQTVPLTRIRRVYKPQERLQQILKAPKSELEEILVRFVVALSSESSVSLRNFGASGSILIGLTRESSDVDLVVYGQDEGRYVYDALRKLRKLGSWIEPYTTRSIGNVLVQRWGQTGIDPERLVEIELSKVLHGRVSGRDYFIRLIRDYDDSSPSTPVERVIIKGKITNSSYSIFTPVTYKMSEIEWLTFKKPIKSLELLSYRGKFTEHAVKGDKVEVRGMLEEVRDSLGKRFRVVLGDDRDYMIPWF